MSMLEVKDLQVYYGVIQALKQIRAGSFFQISCHRFSEKKLSGIHVIQ